jgi:uncharacterized membrane protein
MALPFALKGAGKLVRRAAMRHAAAPASEAAERTGNGEQVKGAVGRVGDAIGHRIEHTGDAAGAAAMKAGKSILPGRGEGAEGEHAGVDGHHGLPVQEAVDVGVPLETAYNQWTQFEDWPRFMHRLEAVTQEDDATVSFRAKVWGVPREFEARIVQQRPDERIRWTVAEGVRHTGVATFHRLSDRLTRIQVTLDVEPDSLIERAARGMRHVQRTVREDLGRFKAFIEMQDAETGAWRGTIEDGEVVREGDRSTEDEGLEKSGAPVATEPVAEEPEAEEPEAEGPEQEEPERRKRPARRRSAARRKTPARRKAPARQTKSRR